ncbi:hypothetical protein Y1Q_0011450 [Alligator mississippiensis]|uniref:Uncharacterized protein n=1 Tax=Alligator mississippiensis TaxID=8496 RepID=A0A151LZU9_ALLMI|nr:hypothetical protein Y1Q_0011450 [Alligator mississippiensis]
MVAAAATYHPALPLIRVATATPLLLRGKDSPCSTSSWKPLCLSCRCPAGGGDRCEVGQWGRPAPPAGSVRQSSPPSLAAAALPCRVLPPPLLAARIQEIVSQSSNLYPDISARMVRR